MEGKEGGGCNPILSALFWVETDGHWWLAGACNWEGRKKSFLGKTRQPKENGRPRKPNSRGLRKPEKTRTGTWTGRGDDVSLPRATFWALGTKGRDSWHVGIAGGGPTRKCSGTLPPQISQPLPHKSAGDRAGGDHTHYPSFYQQLGPGFRQTAKPGPIG